LTRPAAVHAKDGYYEFEGEVTFAKMCGDPGVAVSVATGRYTVPSYSISGRLKLAARICD
jgi:hypothetical protein